MGNISSHIGYHFKDKKIINLALTHKSYSDNNNERLEFLGDRVLGLTISTLIFKKFQNLNEGDLTKKLSYFVQKNFLYKNLFF